MLPQPVKGKPPAAGKAPAAAPTPVVRRVLPAVNRSVETGSWMGLGHTGLKTLDLCGNVLGDTGVAAVAHALQLSIAEVAAVAAAAAAAAEEQQQQQRKSPGLGKGAAPSPRRRSATAAGGAALSVEEQLAAGTLHVAAVKPKALRVNLTWNRASFAACEGLEATFGVVDAKTPGARFR